MLSWHLSKAATYFGEAKWFLPLFLDVSVATTFDVSSKNSSSELRKLTSSSWYDNSFDVKELDAAFFLFSYSTFCCLDLSSLQLFLSTPAKQPGRPGSLCLCKNILSSSIFILSRASACAIYQISYPNPFGISQTAAYLGISYYFFEAPTKHDEDSKVSLHSLERISWLFSPFSQKIMHPWITGFALSLTVNLTSQIFKNKTARICLFDGSFAPVIWWFTALIK